MTRQSAVQVTKAPSSAAQSSPILRFVAQNGPEICSSKTPIVPKMRILDPDFDHCLGVSVHLNVH